MPSGRGSSSSATVLAEAIRLGTAPAGIVLRERDDIVAIGALVAAQLDGIHVPVIVATARMFSSITPGATLTLP